MNRVIENAEKEMTRGNLWRAKEILQGSIPNAGYNRDLFEKLGMVLLTMGDLPEAGRFLFLADCRKKEFEHAIDIFLSKHAQNWQTLMQTFPRVAKLSTLSEYPDNVRSQLVRLGCPQVLKTGPVSHSGHSGSAMTGVIGWLIVGSILAVMLLGIIKIIDIVKWIF